MCQNKQQWPCHLSQPLHLGLNMPCILWNAKANNNQLLNYHMSVTIPYKYLQYIENTTYSN